MEIRRLSFDGFGRFPEGLSATFGPGVNVVIGPNESGKSTLVEGLIGILFGLRDKDDETARKPRQPHREYAGELHLVTPSGEYRIRRNFETNAVLVTRKNGRNEVTLYDGDANPRGRTDDLLAYTSVIEEITGLADREMSLRTLFMNQGELETAVDERVRHLLSGTASGDYGQVVERLERRYFALTRENPWGRRKSKPKELEMVQERIADAQKRIVRAREVQAAAGRLVEEIDESRKALAGARSECDDRETLFQNYNEFFELNRDRSDLEKRLATVRDDKEKVKEILAEYRRVETELWPRFECFRRAGPEFGESLRSLSVLRNDVDALEEEHRTREEELAATPWPRNFRRGMLAGFGAAVVTFAAFTGAGAALIGAAVGLALGVAAFAGVYLMGKGRERVRMRLEAQVIDLTDRLEAQQGELGRLEDEVRSVTGDRKLRDIREEYREFREKTDLLSRYEQILQTHRSAADLESDYEQVFQKLRIIDSRARDLIARAPYLAGADENLAEVERRLETARREQSEARARVEKVVAGLNELQLRRARFEGAAAEDVEALEEELEELVETRLSLERNRDGLALAVEVLRESIHEFQESHVERLAVRAGDLMDRVTAGRYCRVSLDRNFEPSVITPAGEAFSTRDMSRGAVDQLHLALRLAITGNFTSDNPTPILMDDVLVNCDQARLVMIRRLLDDLATQGRQVLLFAHDPRYREWGKVALDLDPGSAERPSKATPRSATPARRG